MFVSGFFRLPRNRERGKESIRVDHKGGIERPYPFFASDALKGRMIGMTGYDITAEYAARLMYALALEAANSDTLFD